MKYDFDTLIDRTRTDSLKWKNLEKTYGSEDILPMWLADMDFKTSPEILESFREKINHGIFGYYKIDEEIFQSVINWMEKRHGLRVDRSSLVFVPGAVTGLKIALRAIVKPGDNIIIQPPIYPPFYSLGKGLDLEILENPLVKIDGSYTMDYKNLKTIINEKTRVIVISNPHNPTGRVWGEEELRKLGEICLQRNILIISDDVHSDIIRKNIKYLPISKISDKIGMNSISLFSPSKSFNLAGLSTSFAIIPNKELKKKFIGVMNEIHMPVTNIFGKEGLRAAYDLSSDWLDKLNIYLDGNIKFAKAYIDKNIELVEAYIPEGTFLMWLDFSRLAIDNGTLEKYLIEEGHILLENGEKYGLGGSGYFRINIATPRKVLKEGLRRIKNTVEIIKSDGGIR